MRSILAFSLALLPVASFAIVDATPTNAFEALDTSWAWVGQMGGASAVAIGPRTILTAGHVGASDFWLDGQDYRMTSTVAAPKIDGSAVDLRIVQLSDVLPGWYTLGTSAKTNSGVTMVGYGGGGVVNSIDSGYVLEGNGGRRAGNNVVSSHNEVKGLGPTLRSLLTGAGRAALTGGDSGGGWFENGKLVGISSFTFLTQNKPMYGWSKKAYFGSSAIDLTDSKVRSWVESKILPMPTTPALARSLDLRTLASSPADTSSVGTAHAPSAPEPGSLLALGTGAIALLRRRRPGQGDQSSGGSKSAVSSGIGAWRISAYRLMCSSVRGGSSKPRR